MTGGGGGAGRPEAPAAGAVSVASPTPTGGIRTVADRPRSFYVDTDGRLQRDLHPREIVDAVRRGAGALWVDIDASNRHQHALLEKVFHFHPLTIEDTLNPQSRVKYEEHEQFLFVVARGVRFCDDTSDPYDIETLNLCFFLSRNVLVTTHLERAPAVTAMIERLERSPDLMGRGAGRLMHAIMDTAVDAFFPVLDRVDEFVDGLEERVFVTFDDSALRDIFSVKRLVLSLRRQLGPQREVFNVLTNRPTALLSQDTQIYFRDIYDHQLRIADAIDTYRDLLSSTLDSYLTQVSNRLGATSKRLTAIATLTTPFVVVSGMWGMNFRHIPWQDSPHAFWWMLVGQIGIGALLLVVLRWRKLV